MRSVAALVLVLATHAVFVSPVDGQMNIQSVTRSVFATAFGDSDPGCPTDQSDDSFTELGSYVAAVSAFAPPDFNIPNCQSEGTASASQDSFVSDTEVSGIGSAGAIGTFAGGGTGISSIDVEFSLAGPVSYSLSGELAGQFGAFQGPSAAQVLLESSGATVHSIMQDDPFLPTAFGFTGQLQPGPYRLLVLAEISAGLEGGDSSFEMTFVVPEPTLTSVGIFFALLGLLRKQVH